MKFSSHTPGSFRAVARAQLQEQLKLTPGERINRALELTEIGRALAKGLRPNAVSRKPTVPR